MNNIQGILAYNGSSSKIFFLNLTLHKHQLNLLLIKCKINNKAKTRSAYNTDFDELQKKLSFKLPYDCDK